MDASSLVDDYAKHISDECTVNVNGHILIPGSPTDFFFFQILFISALLNGEYNEESITTLEGAFPLIRDSLIFTRNISREEATLQTERFFQHVEPDEFVNVVYILNPIPELKTLYSKIKSIEANVSLKKAFKRTVRAISEIRPKDQIPQLELQEISHPDSLISFEIEP